MPVFGPERADEVVRALRAGGLAAIPTDTVYGVAAMPDDAAAVRALAALKGRPGEHTAVDQAFPLHFCILQSNQKLDSGNVWERGYLHRKLELGL